MHGYENTQHSNRFRALRKDTNPGGLTITVWLDRLTGVQYLSQTSPFGVGLTPLLNKHGNVHIVDVTDEQYVPTDTE